ncbi:hypothetical protein QZH41_014282, partial [Actinostola sp. cb2023]
CILFDFETGRLDGWTLTGTVFNNQPTYGDNPTARGNGVPSHHQGDWWIGGTFAHDSFSMLCFKQTSACSPNPCHNGGECTVLDTGQYDYVCNCTGGYAGRNCHKKCILFDFETGRLDDWTLTGTVFNNQPTYGDNPTARGNGVPSHHQGNWWIGGYENRSSPSHTAGAIQGDGPTGTMTSPPFIIQGTKLKFLIGGGSDTNSLRMELLIQDAIIYSATSDNNTETMTQKSFDVTNYRGQIAQLRVVDRSSGGWGHINVDHIEDSICTE